jgi:hypothetical protein
MTEKSEIIADTHSPSLPVNKIHPMVKRAVQIAAGFDPTTSANWPEGAPTTIQSAIDKLAARESVATGSLTATQFNASTTAVDLIASPGAGKVNIIESVELFLDYGSAAFAAGSDVAIQYNTSSPTVAMLVVDSFFKGTADTKSFAKPTIYDLDAATGTASGADAAGLADKKIQILTTGSAFTTGTGCVIKYRIVYKTVTLLT